MDDSLYDLVIAIHALLQECNRTAQYANTYIALQILGLSPSDTTHLKVLFDKTIFKYDKDHSGSSEPNL